MAKLADTVRWRDTSGGVIMDVSSDITIPNSVPFSMNLLYDEVLGLAVSRDGSARVGSQISAGNTCLGLYNFRDSVGTNHKLFAAFNGSIFNAENGASEVGSLSTSAKCYFTTFLDTTLMLNGSQSIATTGNGTWASSGTALNAGQVPTGAQFPIEWKDRVYAAVVDRLYYTTTPSGGSVSWTASGSGSIQVEQEDGGGTITGTAKVPGYLLIFKERSLKRWNFDSAFPEDLINIGTQSQASVSYGRGRVFFFYGPKGFYHTNGGYPDRISNPIQPIVDAIPSAFYQNVGGWCDNEHVYWSVGDLTIPFDYGYTETHANVVVRYSIETQEWALLKYANEFRFWSGFIDGTTPRIVAGDTDGNVIQVNTGTTDVGGAAITYILQSPEIDFGRRELKKTISEKIIVHALYASGAELQRRIDYDQWQSIGSVKGIVTEVGIQPLIGHIFEFRLADSITGTPVKLRGLDFSNVDVHENI